MVTGSSAAPHVSQPLADWLSWLESLHPTAIDMGLARVAAVADRLDLRPAKKPMILVGGTNGKGSTVAMLSAIYCAAGYKTGAYTSPHITHFCERISIDGQPAEETQVVDALAYIEALREPESLTYFEYTTLAAMRVFNVLSCDVVLFEVGLGGRLDATNIWDADCSIVTSIALDHEDWLGSDVSVIATEKAAIGREGKPFIIGEAQPPFSLKRFATEHGFQCIDIGSMPPGDLPQSNLPGEHQRRNAGCAKAAVNELQTLLPVKQSTIEQALATVSLQGRFELVSMNGVPVILDVAHNPAGAYALVDAWQTRFADQRCDIVFATLADKDTLGVVTALSDIAHTWHCITLDVPRAQSADQLADTIRANLPDTSINTYIQAEDGFQAALNNAYANNGAVLVAGSFYTIALARAQLTNLS